MRDPDEAFDVRVSNLITRRPVICLLAGILLIAACVTGLKRLSFSNDIEIFFDEKDPDLLAFKAVEETYADSTNVLFVVSPEEPGATVFEPKTLSAIQELTDLAWKTPHSQRVDSLTNFQHSWAQDDDLMVEDLVAEPAETLDETAIAEIRETALSEPLLVDKLVSNDGRVTGVNVVIRLPGQDPLKEQPEVAGYVEEIAADIEEKYPHLEIRLTGITMINQALSEATANDFARLVPLMFLIILVTLAVMLRSILSALISFLVVVCSIVCAFGLSGWLGIGLSPPIVSAVNMIMTLAVADSVHVLTAFRNYLHQGKSRRDAMRASLIHNLRPVFLTSITTLAGFLTLRFSESPPFRDLGTVVAIGVGFAWLFVHLLVAPIMVLVPSRIKPMAAGQSAATGWNPAFTDWILSRRLSLLVAGLVLTLVSAALISRNELNDEFVKYFGKSTDFRQATDFTIENLTGFEYIDFAIKSGEPGGISDPEFLRNLEAFSQWLREQPRVRHVYTYTDIIKRLHRNLFNDDPAYHRLPDGRDVATDCLTLYEFSLPFGLDLTDRINLDKSGTRVTVSLDSITSNEMLDLEARARDWLREHEFSPDTAGTGQSIMFAHIGRKNIISLLGGNVGGLIFISFLLIFFLRSLKCGLLSILPNLAPVIVGFGLWGLLVGKVGLATSVVVGVTMGVVVDDTIHFLTRYLNFRREQGLAPEAAARKALNEVGSALVTSTVALGLGFIALSFSGFELNRGMGILSSIVIVLALVFDLFVLPGLLIFFDRQPKTAPVSSPSSSSSAPSAEASASP